MAVTITETRGHVAEMTPNSHFSVPVTMDRNGRSRSPKYALYEQEDRVMLFLEGETRKTRNGDLVIWELILERPDYYRWRTYGSPADWRNSVVGQRCKT